MISHSMDNTIFQYLRVIDYNQLYLIIIIILIIFNCSFYYCFFKSIMEDIIEKVTIIKVADGNVKLGIMSRF